MILMLVVVAILVVAIVYIILNNQRENFKQDSQLDIIISNIRPYFPIVDQLNFYDGTKSYTVNKKDVFICMRDEHGNYYDTNFLTFVILHEISHALCDEIGHTDKFSNIFDHVLYRASKAGIYNKNGKKILNYCNYTK